MRSRTMKLLSLALAVCLLLCGCNLIRTDPEYVKQQEAEKAAAEQAAYEADMATVLATYYGDRVVTKGDAVDTYNEQMDMYSSYVTYMNYMASMFGISESQSITAEDAARVRDNVVKEIVKTRVLDQKMLDLGFAAFTEEELAAIQTDATNEYNTYVENAREQRLFPRRRRGHPEDLRHFRGHGLQRRVRRPREGAPGKRRQQGHGRHGRGNQG